MPSSVLPRSGKTARLVSKHRPKAPIIVATYTEEILRRTCLYWGTQGLVIEKDDSTDAVITQAINKALAYKYIKPANVLVVITGEPMGLSGTTNVVQVQIVGNILGRGTAFGNRQIKGKVWKYDPHKTKEKYEILVAKKEPEENAILNSQAVIIESKIIKPKTVKKAMHKGIIIMFGVKGIYKKVSEGEVIQLDPQRGLIWR